MSSYLLDTNHLSPIVTVGHLLQIRILASLRTGATFAIVAPVLNEFLFGISSVPRVKQNLRIWNNIKSEFVYFAVDSFDAEVAADWRTNLMHGGKQIGLVDSFVAVVALRYDLTLLTADKDFLAFPNLKQENWL